MKLCASIRSLWDAAYLQDMLAFHRTGISRTDYVCFGAFLDYHFSPVLDIPAEIVAKTDAKSIDAALKAGFIEDGSGLPGTGFRLTRAGADALYGAYKGQWLY